MLLSTAPEFRGGSRPFADKSQIRRHASSGGRLSARVGWTLASAFALAAGADKSSAAPATATFQAWTNSEAAGPLPGVVLDALDGGEARLSNDRGEIVLVHFFATWCEPCRTELPALDRFAARHARRGLGVVAIAVADVAPAVRRFLERWPVALPILLDPDRALAKAWDIYALPTTVILDSALAPTHVAIGEVDWDDPAIDRLIDGFSLPRRGPRFGRRRAPLLYRSRPPLPFAAQSGRTP